MTPQELKDSIVQLALQGKAVEHDPREGTGDEALKKAIKTVQSVRASFSNDDYTLDLPESWTWAKLSEITSEESLNDGNWVLSKDMATNGPVKLIQLGSIGNCKYKDKGFKYLTEEHFHELNGRQIYSGYLLVNRLIGDRMLACILPPLDGILMTAVDVCWIAPNDEIYDLHYLMYALTSSDFQSKVKALGRGTTRFRISKLNLIDIAFPFPPLAEQKRIVAKIEELLPLIERYEKAWSRLEAFNKRFPVDMQKSILQMAIQGKLVEQRPGEGTGEELYKQIQAEKQALIKAGKIKKEKPLPEITEDEIPFEIPENWKWVRVGSIGSWSAGATPSRTNPNFYGGNIPWLKTGDLNDGYVSEVPEYITQLALEKASVRLNPVGSVLMAMYGATIGKLGIAKIPLTTNQACCACIPYEGIYNRYLFFYLLAMRTAFIKMGEGGAQPNISKEKIVSALIPLPPLTEQKRIVARLEELLPLCERLK